MTSTSDPIRAVTCGVVAKASLRASAAEIPALRKSPGCLGDSPIAPNLLRHADEQTVVGVSALLRAAGQGGAVAGDYADWAVLAAPRYLGRAMFEVAFPQFLAEGAWGVSPYLIPAHSLHSASGAISLAIQARGPNLGIGGAIGGGLEGLLAAATWLEAGMAPGVWLVLSGRVGDAEGEVGLHPPGDYEALAIAMVPESAAPLSTRLRIRPGLLQVVPGDEADPGLGELAAWLKPARFESGSPTGRAKPAIRLDAGDPSGPSRPPHFRPAAETPGPVPGHREKQ